MRAPADGLGLELREKEARLAQRQDGVEEGD